MKTIVAFVCIASIAFCRTEREVAYDYTGSTPAAAVIRPFLGIPLNDSIDFIRWNLILRDNQYQLSCNYGISKPNTNGFINDGKKIEISGAVKKDQHYYQLQNGDKVLHIAGLNTDLLHLLDADKKLLIGNAGWSYTLSNTRPAMTDEINIIAKQTVVKDSIAFEGRTPCNVPGIIPDGMLCYKLKWYIVLYPDAVRSNAGQCRIFGTPWRKEGGRPGNWEITTGKNGRIIYQFKNERGNSFFDLLKLDENILVFIDKKGKLLVGDHDFSYTINRFF